MQKDNKPKPSVSELMLVSVLVEPKDGEELQITFRSQTADKILFQLCKEDPNNWNLFKKVVNDTLDKIETAAKEK